MKIRAEISVQQGKTGKVWEAVLIAPGVSKSVPAFDWTPDVLRASESIFEGVDINAYEIKPGYHGHVPAELESAKQFLISNKAGTVTGVRYVQNVGLVGEISLLPKYGWVADSLLSDPNALGLSIDARITAAQQDTDPITPDKILSASSVDIVTRPAAGGKFIRAVAAQGDDKMKKKLIEQIKTARPELLEGKDAEKMTEDEVFLMAQQAMEPAKAVEATPVEDIRAAQEKAIQETLDDIKNQAACDRVLAAKMAESDLPDLTKKRIMEQFGDKVFETSAIDIAIKAEKEYIAAMSETESGIPTQDRAQVGPDGLQKIQAAVDKMFELDSEDIKAMQSMDRLDGQALFPDLEARQSEAMTGLPRISGLGELYQLLTGDGEVSGSFNPANLSRDLRATQAVTSSTFSYILGNTMARRLVKDYKSYDFGENLLISLQKAVKDFRLQEAVMLGYFGDIPEVDPESADYTEISPPTDEESTYTIGQKGVILTVTRKTILNDDMSMVKRLVSRMGRAARRTHAKYVWALFTGNANCSDGTAWFTSGHGNLGATAMSFATVLTAYKALAAMTELSSSEKIGWLDDASAKPTLIYPIDLMETGEMIVNDMDYYSTNDLTDKTRNTLKGKINGRMISLLSDTNDWGLLMPPKIGDMIEMGYLQGRKEPEMFMASQPTSEQVFVADKVRYKIRHEYAGAVVDYRTGYKAVVA